MAVLSADDVVLSVLKITVLSVKELSVFDSSTGVMLLQAVRLVSISVSAGNVAKNFFRIASRTENKYSAYPFRGVKIPDVGRIRFKAFLEIKCVFYARFFVDEGVAVGYCESVGGECA